VVPAPIRLVIAVLLALAFALAVRSRLAARRTLRLARERGKLLEDVGLLQAALLPIAPPRLGPVGTSAAYRPADGPAAGGDFYDVFALESGQIAAILGDISGHGRQALPHTALVRFTLKAYLEAGLAPREAIQIAGAVLERQLGESLATVVVATYQPRKRELVYACAGHPPPIVLGSLALSPITACSALPIGAGRRTGTRQTTVSLPGAARVCFYTDGLTEARVGSQLFGSERLQDSLAELGPHASASALMDSVAKQTDARPDDMAACLLSITGGDREPAVVMEELELSGEELCTDRAQRFLLACGIEPRKIEELLSGVRPTTKRGTYVLRACLAGESQQLTLRPSTLTALHTAEAQRPALVARGSR
jgi:serine phosphatase RsbU (regulator of sigma subunit)